MATRFCSRCGAVLRNGVCPRGHPQRVSRRQGRRRRRGPIVLLILFLLLAAAAYVALSWYPRRAAGELMRPSSQEFAQALGPYQDAVEAFPTETTDPSAAVATAEELLALTPETREALSRTQGSLEARSPTNIPFISDRPPLGDALRIRDQMLAFYTEGLELVADMESVAGYVTELGATLPQVDNLHRVLRSGDDVEQLVAAASPVADQILADLGALVPPSEVGAVHESLVAVAERIQGDLEEIEGAGEPGSSPVVSALLDDIQAEIETIRTTLAQTTQAALEGGLQRQMADADALVASITEGLITLRDGYEISGLVIPSA